jgi:molecular chaperone GrpE (heat shock protein)
MNRYTSDLSVSEYRDRETIRLLEEQVKKLKEKLRQIRREYNQYRKQAEIEIAYLQETKDDWRSEAEWYRQMRDSED